MVTKKLAGHNEIDCTCGGIVLTYLEDFEAVNVYFCKCEDCGFIGPPRRNGFDARNAYLHKHALSQRKVPKY